MTQVDDLSQLSDLLAAHVEAVNSGDVEALLDQLTDDVVYLGQGIDPIIGKAQMEAVMRSFHRENRAIVSLIPTDRSVSGDLAHEWGSLTGEFRNKDGGDPIRVNSKYFYLYRRGPNGRWRISHECVSDNAPASDTSSGEIEPATPSSR